MIVNIVNEILTNFNNLIAELNSDISDEELDLIEHEISKILAEMSEMVQDESYLLDKIDALHTSSSKPNQNLQNQIIEITHGNTPIGTIAQNVMKPFINYTEIDRKFECNKNFGISNQNYDNNISSDKSNNISRDNDLNNNLIHNMNDLLNNLLNKKKMIKFVDTSQALKEFIQTLNQTDNSPIFIHSFTHSYHTYVPFTCYLLVRVFETDFIFNLISHNELLNKNVLNDLFSCKFNKFMNEETLYLLSKQFKVKMCCFFIVQTSESGLVDWRVDVEPKWFKVGAFLGEKFESNKNVDNQKNNGDNKNINDKNVDNIEDLRNNFNSSLSENIRNNLEVKEKYKSFDYNEIYDSSADISSVHSRLCKKLNISSETNPMDSETSSSSTLMKILKLRDFIAKTNNESVGYVLTDTQIVQMMTNKVIDRTRLSPLMRAHAPDFNFVLSKQQK